MPNNVQALNSTGVLDTNCTLEVCVPKKIVCDRRDKTVLFEIATIFVFERVALKPVIGPTTDVVQLCWGEGSGLANFDIIFCMTRYVVAGSWIMQHDVDILRGGIVRCCKKRKKEEEKKIPKADHLCCMLALKLACGGVKFLSC